MRKLFFFSFLLFPSFSFAARISGGGGSGGGAGATGPAGASGASTLEVFSNFDGARSSPTASIAIGDSLKLSVSGSTAVLNVDISSVTANEIHNQNTLQSGATFYVSSGTAVNFNSDDLKIKTNFEYGTSGVGAYMYAQPAQVAIQSPSTTHTLYVSDNGVDVDGTFKLPDLNCSGNTNGGALTVDGTGVVQCSDDDSGGGGGVTVYPATSPITVMLDSSFDGINSPAISVRNMHDGTYNGASFIAYTATNTRLGAVTFDVSTDAGYGDIGFYGMTGQGKLARIFSDASTDKSFEFNTTGDSNIFMRNSGQGRISWTNSASLFNFAGNVDVDNALTVAGADVCLEDGTNCPAGGVTGSTVPITIGFSGGGSAIAAGVENSTTCTTVPFALTLSSWTVIAPPPSVSGSISVTIRKATYNNFPVFSAMSAGGNPPSLTSAAKNAGTPTSWTSTSISAGDVVCAEVTSATSVTRAVVTLWGYR